MNQLSTDWYLHLVEECKAILTEASFTSRWALVEGYHHLGERIVTDQNLQWNSRGNGKMFATVAKSIGIGERTLRYSVQFYEMFPDLSLLPLGKDANWKGVVKLLADPNGEKDEMLEKMYYHIRCLVDLVRKYEKPKDEKEVKLAFLFDLRNWLGEKLPLDTTHKPTV